MVQNLKDNKWLQDADLNLAAELRQRMQSISQAKLIEKNGVLSFTVGKPTLDSHLNGVFRYKTGSSDNEVIDLCNQLFEWRPDGFVLWIREHGDINLEKHLKELGLKAKRETGVAAMIIRKPLPETEAISSLEISHVNNKKDLEDFALVTEKAFDLSPDLSKLAISPASNFKNSKTIAFLIREKNKPLASGMTILEDDVAGIYYIGVLTEARGRGLGKLITSITTNAGFSLGARAVVLQASALGEPIYQKLGYEIISHFRCYPVLTKLPKISN